MNNELSSHILKCSLDMPLNDASSTLCEEHPHDQQFQTDMNRKLYSANLEKFQFHNDSELIRLHTTHFELSIK